VATADGLLKATAALATGGATSDTDGPTFLRAPGYLV